MKTRMMIYSLVAVMTLAAVTPQSYAGRLDGPGIAHRSCSAYGSVSYRDTFLAGRLAQISVRGDGDTDLDLYVYDENGNLVASDTDGLDYCVVQFNPKWTGRFRIVVRNLGSVYNRYTLRTN